MTFGISPTADVATPQETLQAAYTTPFAGSPTLGGLLHPDITSENFQQAAGGTDFGIGSVIRDLSTPADAGPPKPGPLSLAGPLGMGLDATYQAVKAGINALRPSSPTMTQQQYEQSPDFRHDVPYDPGMTEARAAALAAQSDTTKARAFFSQLQPLQAYTGSLAGMAVDPINYIPIAGEAVTAAAGARFGAGFLGKLGAQMLGGASEAALNTAAFGALSSQLRAQYGDDTSLATYGNEIFMAGLLGAGFGAVHGVVGAVAAGREADAAARQSLELLKARDAQTNIENLIRARIAGNDAVGSLATKGHVDLQPTALDAVQRIADDTISRSQGQRDLAGETAGVGKAPVAPLEGEAPAKPTSVVVTPSGSRVEVRPEIVDASTLQAAAGANQVRDRSGQNINSSAQIQNIAANLDPAQLMPNVAAGMGSPIVGPDNIVDSGNGRVAAIIHASEAYPAKYAAYKQALEAAGYKIPDGVKTPVLISRRVTPLSDSARAQFNAEANAPTVAQMSPVEIAAMDRAALDEATMSQLADAPVNSPANRGFVGAFMARLGPTERGALLDRDGNLNQAGVQRMENALVARAYADVDDGVLRKFAEATDDNTRAIVGAMSDVAGRWALMRSAIRRGEIAPEFDMTPELTGALRAISRWRDQAATEGRSVAQVIKEGMAQSDMFTGDMSPEAKAMIRALYTSDDFTRAVGREKVAARLTKMADVAQELGKPQLFGMPEVDRLGVIEHGARDGEGDLFQADALEQSAQRVGAGGGRYSTGPDRQGDRQGIGSDNGVGSLLAQPEDGTGPAGAAGGGAGTGAAAGDVGPRSAAEAGEAPDAKAAAKLMAMADAGDIEGIKASPELAAVTERMAAKPTTDKVEGYGSEKWAESRVYETPEGETLHGVQAAVDHLTDNARNLAADELGIPRFETAKDRKAVIIIGPPAAGKSTIANEIARRMKAAIPDPDEAKKLMPEYEGGLGSNAVHEESSLLSNITMDGLTHNGDNLVIPKVGGNPGSIEKLRGFLKGAGYDVDLMLMDVPPREAFRRMIGRYASTGRLIPPHYFEEVSHAPAESFESLKKEGKFDGTARVTSDRGAPARVSESELKTVDLKAGDEITTPVRERNRGSDGGNADDGKTAPNEVANQGNGIVDASTGSPDPVPDGLAFAAETVGKPESLLDMAKANGVDLASGEYLEHDDVKALADRGGLTPDEVQELAAADENYSRAEEYGNALKAAASCLV